MTTNVVISRITLFSADIDKTAEFYKVIGFNFEKSGSWSGKCHYLDVVKQKGQDIVIFEIYPLGSESTVSPYGFGFNVENVPQILQKLIEMGAPVLRPGNPRVYNYCTLASVKDPDGRTVTITQHDRVKPA